MGLWANMIKAMKSPLFKKYLKDGDYEVKNSVTAMNYASTGGIANRFSGIDGDITNLETRVEEVNGKVETGSARKKYLYHVYMSILLSTDDGNQRLNFSFSHLSSYYVENIEGEVSESTYLPQVFQITGSGLISGNGYLVGSGSAPIDIFGISISHYSGGYKILMYGYESDSYEGSPIVGTTMVLRTSVVDITEF